MANHRKPPKPAHWRCERGTCRFCGEEIVEGGKVNRRKHWHQPCADLWKIMNNPADARKFVLKRDRFTCQGCGYHDRFGEFDVDHVEPLFEATDLSSWHPNNLRLLCGPCHYVKTSAEATRRASRRRNHLQPLDGS